MRTTLSCSAAGDFPQAFSHAALINTAHNFARAEKSAEQRSVSTENQSARRKRCTSYSINAAYKWTILALKQMAFWSA
jgi:hypothetical protein